MRQTKTKVAKKKPLSEEAKRQRTAKRQRISHRNSIRAIFLNAGLSLIPSMEGKYFEYKNARSDFDDIFVLENLIIIAEYTISNQDQIEAHLLKKNFVYRTINEDQSGFVAYLRENFPTIRVELKDIYADDQVRPIFLYCSRNELKETTKTKAEGVKYLDFINVMYFQIVANTVKNQRNMRYLISWA